MSADTASPVQAHVPLTSDLFEAGDELMHAAAAFVALGDVLADAKSTDARVPLLRRDAARFNDAAQHAFAAAMAANPGALVIYDNKTDRASATIVGPAPDSVVNHESCVQIRFESGTVMSAPVWHLDIGR